MIQRRKKDKNSIQQQSPLPIEHQAHHQIHECEVGLFSTQIQAPSPNPVLEVVYWAQPVPCHSSS